MHFSLEKINFKKKFALGGGVLKCSDVLMKKKSCIQVKRSKPKKLDILKKYFCDKFFKNV